MQNIFSSNFTHNYFLYQNKDKQLSDKSRGGGGYLCQTCPKTDVLMHAEMYFTFFLIHCADSVIYMPRSILIKKTS